MSKRGRPHMPDGLTGKVTTATGEQWPVAISEHADDALMLVMLVGSGSFPAGGAQPVLLECTSDAGLARLTGEAKLERRDLLRFRVTDPPEVVQRREFVRIQAVQSVVVARSGEGELIGTHAVDISGGGMLLTGPDTLEVGDHLRFRLHLGSDIAPIKGIARVVRNGGDGRRALVFDDISRDDRERLIRFIFDLQREARAKTRND